MNFPRCVPLGARVQRRDIFLHPNARQTRGSTQPKRVGWDACLRAAGLMQSDTILGGRTANLKVVAAVP